MEQSELYKAYQARTEALIGPDALQKLRGAKVAVFGLGGVGSYVVEALARAGIGTLVLVDGDEVARSNLNRQLIATADTVGMRKTEAAAARVHAIAPFCQVIAYDLFYLPEVADRIDFTGLSYVADAVDTVTAKIEIIKRAKAAGVPVITCMGTGNKLSAQGFAVSDIEKTSVCPLARVMRRELKNRRIGGVKAVYSTEEPQKSAAREDGRCVPASISFVPGAAGLVMAGEIVRDILEK